MIFSVTLSAAHKKPGHFLASFRYRKMHNSWSFKPWTLCPRPGGGLHRPQLYNALTSGMMTGISENSEKRAGFSKSGTKGIFSDPSLRDMG